MLCPLLIAGMASAVTYSVAGSSAALFGASWSETNTSTDMTSTDGVIYTFTKEGVTLSKGTIEYKVVVDHSWGTAYGKEGGNDNATYTISEDGVYDVVVSFNAETHVPSMEATKKGSATVEHTWSIIGAIFGTNWNEDFPMTKVSDNIYTYTVTDLAIAKGDYEYKARADNKWELSYPNQNAHLVIAEDATYDITFTLDLTAGTVNTEVTKKGEAVIEATYTVAGAPTEVIGSYWNPSGEGNDMTAVGDGTYTLTKENVTIAAKTTIEFKIVKNHSWGPDNEYGDGGLGGGNVVYNVADDGLYNVTFTFNPEETTVTPQITVTPVTYDFTQHAYRVCGEGFAGGWGTSEGDATMNPMTLTDGKYVFTKSGYEVAEAHSESYRIRVDDAYLTNVSPFTIDGIQNNKTVTFDAAGTYDVTVTFDPVALTVSAVATAAVTPDPDTYTIVGVEDVINGDAAWDPTATANDMTENAGVWTLTVEGANLEAGQEYLYKMVKNHDWGDGEVPAQGNQTLTVEETAEYTITYTFDGTTLSCNATKAGGDEPVDGQELVNGEHKVVIKGVHYLNLAENNYVLTIKSEETMTGLGGSFWHTSAGDKDIRENMTVAEDGKTITLTATSTTDPQLYTPLYVLIKDVNEVNFGNVTIEWQEEGEVQNSVTFVNSRDWATVYAYTFDGDGEVLGAWPGTEMTKTDATVDGHDVYTIDITGAPLMIIFHNNAGVQTPNYEFVNGKQYDYPEAKNYTAKFVNIPGWSSVNTYVFNGSVNNGWPGQVATADGTKANVFGGEFDVYTATASLSVDPATIIFNNGDGTQTGDLPFVEGATYSWGSDITEGYFLFTDDADQFMPKQNYDVAGAKASYARKFTPNNVCTVVLPFAIGADVAKAAGKFYRINSIADGYIRGTEETPAPYIPYIFIPAKEYPFTNIGIGQLPEVQNNSITTAEGYTLQFVTETTELASDASYDYYGFQGGKFVKAAYATVNPFRSYIKVAKSANAPATLIWTDDEATGISSLKADIQNGKADVYDLQGRRVLNPVRGLYIVNGKKVIVK